MSRSLVLALTSALLLPLTAAFAQPIVIIDGAGDGHGVGMSQDGAYGMAAHGADYTTILAHYYSGTAIATVAPRDVRVLLAGPHSSASFSGATHAGRRRLSPARTYRVRAVAGGLRLGSATFRAPLIVSGRLVFGGRRYRGRLEILGDGTVLNLIALDDYVRGVVPNEADPSWPAAALEAQAVAARTFALTSHPSSKFDVYSDTRSQAYGGEDSETRATDAATAATANQIVTYGGVPAITYYFSSSGGETENVENAFPGSKPEPWLLGVADPYDNNRWGPIRMSLQSAQARLGGLVHGTLRAIDVIKRGVSPRIVSARIVASGGSAEVSGDQLAAAFGLRSTWACFDVAASGTPDPGWDAPCQGPGAPAGAPAGGTPAP